MGKEKKYLQLIICFVTLGFGCADKSLDGFTAKTVTVNEVSTSTFRVWGNCEMCKETIENSVHLSSVLNSNWDTDSKIMTVEYKEQDISLQDIQKQIASVGYDNIGFKGNDSAYNELPECCKYERR